MKKFIARYFFVFFVFCAITLSAIAADEAAESAGLRAYAVGAPYMTLADEISFEEIKQIWEGADTAETFVTNSFSISEKSVDELREIFRSAPNEKTVKILNDKDLAETAETQNGWVIIPFEDIDPRWKIMMINGESILSNTFDAENWPLMAVVDNGQADNKKGLPVLNRDGSKLTNVVLTGVTAMVRATAQYMDLDPLYPASLIRQPLIDADILHINNEVPFAPVCAETAEDLAALRFCSKSSYMDLLEDIGVDVVELDGDHFQDFGDDAVLYTLDLYDEKNIPYYGGGHNKEEAQKPLMLEHNGNKFAFLGCNGKEIGYAAASETRPGAVHCDIPLMVKQIQDLKKEGIIPIVTFQHVEVYKDKPVEEMRADFEAVRDAGAVIVSGSQSHIPMEFDVYKDSFVHFGLGNLFFDQAFFIPETAVATIDRHCFYDGRYIGTEFLTIRFQNCALSYYMEKPDRDALLSRMFASSIVGSDHD